MSRSRQTGGFERANAITSGGSKYTVNVTIDENVQGGLGLVGRLGDSYVLWDPVRKLQFLCQWKTW